MRRIPFFLGLAFILVTVSRVADFAGGTVLAWSMAIGLTFSVFISAYFLDWERPRIAAMLCLAFFLVVDTAFNLGETLKWSVESGRWDFSLPLGTYGPYVFAFPIYRVADFVYGLFPTTSAALLGWLARKVDRIGVGRKMGFVDTVKAELLKWLVGEIETKAKVKEDEIISPEVSPETVSPETPKRQQQGSKRATIVAYLKIHPQATIAEIVNHANCSTSTASKWRTEFLRETENED
jgi:uncharacterized SAM-binding protein YcdF (DUF218 family)